MPRISSKKAEQLVDAAIERVYYRHAAGQAISILDIAKVYRDARAALASGEDLEAAMPAIVARYCTAG